MHLSELSDIGAELRSARFNPRGSDLYSETDTFLLCAGIYVFVVSLQASAVLTEYTNKAVLPLYMWFGYEFKSQYATV